MPDTSSPGTSKSLFTRLAFSIRSGIISLALWSDRWGYSRSGYLLAIAVGTLPVLLAWLLQIPGHQPLSGIALAILALGPAYRGDARRGLTFITLAFISHCALVIFLTTLSPERTGSILPHAPAYWQQQITWITTGVDKEYEWRTWLPHHFQLAIAASLISFSSLGSLAYYQGFHEVDLMNFYTGELILHSRNRYMALFLAWHIWSIMRGIGYVFLIHETAAFALEKIKGPSQGLHPRRHLRLKLAALFLLADITCKACLTEPCRALMMDNLDSIS
jgi:hypothetical protein